ncbi:hypothetical protein BLAT2472_60301 [Burkholderia latens]
MAGSDGGRPEDRAYAGGGLLPDRIGEARDPGCRRPASPRVGDDGRAEGKRPHAGQHEDAELRLQRVRRGAPVQGRPGDVDAARVQGQGEHRAGRREGRPVGDGAARPRRQGQDRSRRQRAADRAARGRPAGRHREDRRRRQDAVGVPGRRAAGSAGSGYLRTYLGLDPADVQQEEVSATGLCFHDFIPIWYSHEPSRIRTDRLPQRVVAGGTGAAVASPCAGARPRVHLRRWGV